MDLLQNIHYIWTEALDPRVADLPLIASSYQVPLIIFAYLYFVLDCGPKFMENKPPYKLKTFMQLYNIFQILTNMWFIYDTINSGVFSIELMCPVFDPSYDYIPLRLTRCIWYYFLVKILDLIETGVFILRKKDNQVSGLHLYHHVSTFLLAWIVVRYCAVTLFIFFATLNCFVHMIMYTYYFLATYGSKIQKTVTFIKPWITTMQMTQFIVMILYLLHLILRCKIESVRIYWIAMLTFTDIIINLYNFSNFYQETYKTFKKIQ